MAREAYTGTVKLILPDVEGNDPPQHGDTIQFAVTEDVPDWVFVHLKVTQNDVLVAEGWASTYGNATPTFGLYSPAWTGGAAHAVADLVYSLRVGPKGPVWSKPLDTAEFDVVA